MENYRLHLESYTSENTYPVAAKLHKYVHTYFITWRSRLFENLLAKSYLNGRQYPKMSSWAAPVMVNVTKEKKTFFISTRSYKMRQFKRIYVCVPLYNVSLTNVLLF